MTDPGQAEELARLANGLHWDGAFGLPSSCHREVRLVCGPDLDGDGDREAIVQVGWWHATDGNSCSSLNSSDDYWPVTYTFLVARHQSAWRALAALGVGVFGESLDSSGPPEFVRLARGQIGLLVQWANVSSEGGCQIAGYEIYSVRDGVVKKLETRDTSPPCTPCCERP